MTTGQKLSKHSLVLISNGSWPIQKILRAIHIVDNSTIPSKDGPAYRPSCRVRPLLDYYINTVCIHYFTPC